MDKQDMYTSSNLRKHRSVNALQRGLINRFHRAVTALLTQTDARTLLDAGCGEGFAMQSVRARNATQIVGLDSSLGALRVASHMHTHDIFTAGSLTQLPFAKQSFDLVLCTEVLEHLHQPHAGLRELCRVSRRWLLLSVPNEPFFRGANLLRGKNVRAWGNDPEHLNHWSARSFRQFVSTECDVSMWRTSFPWTIVLCRIT